MVLRADSCLKSRVSQRRRDQIGGDVGTHDCRAPARDEARGPTGSCGKVEYPLTGLRVEAQDGMLDGVGNASTADGLWLCGWTAAVARPGWCAYHRGNQAGNGSHRPLLTRGLAYVANRLSSPSHPYWRHLAVRAVTSTPPSFSLSPLGPDRSALRQDAAWQPSSGSLARQPPAQEYETPARRRRAGSPR